MAPVSKALAVQTKHEPVRFPFEKLESEGVREYQQFCAFLEDRECLSVAAFVKTMGWDRDMLEVASRNNWMSRRIEYWNFLVIRQRHLYTRLLEDYYEDVSGRREMHQKRLENAYNQEKTPKKDYIGPSVEVAINAQLRDMDAVVKVIQALKGDGRSITIINQAVGQVNPAADVKRFAAAWDEGANTVVDGQARSVEKAPDSSTHSETSSGM